MKRRNFLAGCLGTATAPAFIKAENLMGLWVPKKTFNIVDPGILISTSDKTIELQKEGHFTFYDVYTFCKESWMSDKNLISFPFPLEATTSEIFKTKSDWTIKENFIKNISSGTLLQNGEIYSSIIEI